MKQNKVKNTHKVETQQPRCLIVDDEPLARDVIKRYLAKAPFLQLAGEYNNAIDAFVFLQTNEIDILFLDI